MYTLICAEHKTHSGLPMVQAAPTGRSQRKPRLQFAENHVGYLMDRVATRRAFPSKFRSPRHYHPTYAPRSYFNRLPPSIITSATDSIVK